jgi:hypothetical protein
MKWFGHGKRGAVSTEIDGMVTVGRIGPRWILEGTAARI